jgi:HAD superfamily 5'-nucleotidase-like hydrolase
MREQLLLPSIDLSAARVSRTPARERRLFCNRSLRLDQIEWVGFDMDYTLAIYDQERMDRLTIDAALPKLIARGYPESLRALDFDLSFSVRGLLVDAKLGNVLKLDRYKYVKRAYHGMRELTYDERRELYHGTRIRTKGSTRFYFIDTLYALSEVTLFAAGVAHMEALGHAIDYHAWFYDIRDAVDISHQDGSIIDAIMSDPARYIVRDPELPLALHKLRSAGKKLFLLTNSRPAYTERIMSFLLAESPSEYRRWQQLFDLVLTAAKKPSFFAAAENTPFCDESGQAVERLERGKLYLGGSSAELARLAGVDGDRVLYVGDHIYGDVLRAKKHSPWRTVMIIQELERELSGVHSTQEATARWDRLEEAREALLEELRFAQASLKHLAARGGQAHKTDDDLERTLLKRQLDATRVRLRAVEAECGQLEQEIERSFHPYWGPLLKAGTEPSSFGHQVETYSCLYTARVSNFLGYSPLHYFRGPRERLPHEL